MEWIKVFESSEKARLTLRENAPYLLRISNQSICLVLRTGVIYAFENKCSHNGEALHKGSVNYLGEIVCPWHGYRFNIKNGRECSERSRDLQTYSVKENEEGAFIGL
jgi:nitrite reductase/ring-hydroxylating ferredoxin subunit